MSQKRPTPADERFYLIRSAGGTFDDASAISAHAHTWSQLIYATTGIVSVSTDHGSWVAPPHWAVWAPAGVKHALRFTGKTSLRTLYLRHDVAPPWPRSAVLAISPLLRELIVRAVQIGMLDERDRTHVALTHLIVSEFRKRSVASLELPHPTSNLLRRVADAAVRNVESLDTNAAMARRFGMSVRSLERGFLNETGLSFGRWRRQARLLHAVRRLGAGAAVKDVAVEAGYQSPSAFIAAFRATFKTTPSRYFHRDN
jgi:AraC-like DNA-binding protein